MGVGERREAAVAERRGRAEDPGPGPTIAQSQPSRRDAGVERALDRDRLGAAAEGRARRHVAREQAARDQVRDRVRQRARQRAARGLHEADARARREMGKRERHARQLAVQSEYGDRQPARFGSSSSPSSTGCTACWSDV